MAMSDQFLLYVLYPVTVSGIIAVFAIIYKIFTNLIHQVNQHETTLLVHHHRIHTMEYKHQRKDDQQQGHK